MTERQPMSVSEMTESLTGFEEIAVEKHMHVDVYLDAETKPMKVLRALVFVDAVREGLTVPDAVKRAQEMPMKQVQDAFPDDDADDDLEDPITAAGEGEPATE